MKIFSIELAYAAVLKSSPKLNFIAVFIIACNKNKYTSKLFHVQKISLTLYKCNKNKIVLFLAKCDQESY